MSAEFMRMKYNGWTWNNAECDVAIATANTMCEDEVAYVSQAITLAMKLQFKKDGINK